MFLNPYWIVSLLIGWSPSLPSVGPTPASASEQVPAAVAVVDTDATPKFELRLMDTAVAFPVMAAFALPGEALELAVPSSDSGFEVRPGAGSVESLGTNRWSWRAPLAPGAYPVQVVDTERGGKFTLNVFVMVPYASMKRGVLNGDRIGEYPQPRGSLVASSARPRGFVQVTPENEDLLVAPHFRLGQFLCKDDSDYPKHLVLRPELLVKLERLLETAQEHGVEASTFRVMSAYRTPAYNRGIGNKTTFTRHQYGDAADIFVDENADGRMDDLNGDGRQNRKDAELLAAWAEEVEHESEDLIGGLSAYHPTHTHGAFVHVDARGYAARW